MNPARSLFFKIFLWFLSIVVLLMVVMAGLFNLDVHLRPDSALIRGVGGHGRTLGRVILRELYDTGYYQWGRILERFSRAYELELVLCTATGRILAGPDHRIPARVMDAMNRLEADLARERRPRPLPLQPVSPPGSGGGRVAGMPTSGHMGPSSRRLPLPPPERLHFSYLVRTVSPVRYWACVPFPFQEKPAHPPTTLFLLAASSSITGNGLFFNPWPWLLLAAMVLVISVLLWIPLVRTITRPISRMTRATEKIAEGHFSVQVDATRSDEIGRLGAAINHMAVQLENLVMGQKRFLGDIAHELSSPVARMELGLSLLEQQVTGKGRDRLADIAEEVRHMSTLINELLSFTRAEISAEKQALQCVALASLVTDVMAQERESGVTVMNRIDSRLQAWAVAGLLRRAIANVLRNAIRYAGQAGPIEITAQQNKDQVIITIADRGPGVPEAAIPRLFDPFYQPRNVRNQKSGGVGLGLAIVKTCIQACGGTVHAQNRQPKGFAVTLTLAGAQSERRP